MRSGGASGTTKRKVGFGLLACVVLLGGMEIALRLAGRGVAVGVWGGFRGGEVRILCVGDSNTYGIGTVPSAFSWPRQLEVAMQGENPGVSVAVYNRGLPGMSSTDVLRFLPVYLEEVAPQVVCMQVGANNTWNLRGASANFEPVPWRIGSWLRHSQVYRAWTIILGRVRGLDAKPPSRDASWPRTQAQAPEEIQIGRVRTDFIAGLDRLRSEILEVHRLCEQAQAVLVLVTYPNMYSVSEVLREVGGAHGIPVVDVAESFSAFADAPGPWWESGLISADGSHPNRYGYGLIAHEVFPAVVASLEEVGVVIRGAASQEEELVIIDNAGELDAWVARIGPAMPLMEATMLALALADAGRIAEAIELLEARLAGHAALTRDVADAAQWAGGTLGGNADKRSRGRVVRRRNMAHRVLGDGGAWMAAETLHNLKAVADPDGEDIPQ